MILKIRMEYQIKYIYNTQDKRGIPERNILILFIKVENKKGKKTLQLNIYTMKKIIKKSKEKEEGKYE